MKPLVSIVVVNWNGKQYLPKCMSSISNQDYNPYEIIVVDNGSTDGSVEWLYDHYPAIKVITNESNVGFAKANNIGIERAQGAYIVLLNNDTWVAPNWLTQLVQPVEENPNIGMVASKMVYADHPSIINSTGICIDKAGISWDRKAGDNDDLSEHHTVSVFGPCAGAALYRKTMLRDVGVFDEEFFIYLEDVDLAWRARWQGWQAVYVPLAKVHHIHSATMREGSPQKTFLLARNKIWLLLKNYPTPHLYYYLPIILIYEVISFLFSVFMGRGAKAWSGRWTGWLAWRRVLKQRELAQASQTISASQMMSMLAPIRSPWQVFQQVQHLYATPKWK